MSLSNSEKILWQVLQDNLEDVPILSITNLSNLAHVSTATVVRTLKKKGYSGYMDFKQSIIAKEKENKYLNIKNMDHDIQQVIMKNEHEVNNTLRMINISTITETIQKIKHSNKIYIFSRGLSELIAIEMLTKFELLNKNCVSFTDPNIIKQISHRIKYGNVLIVISLNGNTPELLEGATNAHKNGASVILFTANKLSPIIKYSDSAFIGFKSDISYFPEFEVKSRLPLQVMSRILLDSYAMNKKKTDR